MANDFVPLAKMDSFHSVAPQVDLMVWFILHLKCQIPRKNYESLFHHRTKTGVFWKGILFRKAYLYKVLGKPKRL